MAFDAGSILGCSLTLQTIQKSTDTVDLSTGGVILIRVSISRVLMTTIRNKGGCPCPRCKTPLSEAHLLGSKRDRKKRLRKMRIDDQSRQNAVLIARKAIYENLHCSIGGAAVEAQLKKDSLVPTSVSHCVPKLCLPLMSPSRMHSPTRFQNLVSIFFPYFMLT